MWYDKVFSGISEFFDQERCYGHTEKIYEYSRWSDFTHFNRAAAYCAEQMKQIGLSDVEMLPLKADGKTAYGDWVVPRAWDASKGVLKVISPDGTGKVVADYQKTPCSLMMYSASTSEEGIKAEVVMTDKPGEVDPNTVRGKFIFTCNAPHTVLSLARKGGAAGIVSDFLPLYQGVRDIRNEVEHLVRWENDFISPVNDTNLFGFNLSPLEGTHLRKLIASSAVRNESVYLYAEVNTRFYDGYIYTVSGMIHGKGSENEEVMICGHLYEPGANDNASGCGVILELAAAVSAAIKEGRIAPPLRNIRFVMGFEGTGLMGYYVSYPERISRTVGAINVDMVGSKEADKAKLHIWHNPWSNWSYMDTLLPELIMAYRDYANEEFEFVEDSFSIGDNNLADPVIGVPTVSMLMYPSLSYHSSIDGMDLIDCRVQRRNALIAGTFLYFIASPEEESVCWLEGRIKEHSPPAPVCAVENLVKEMEDAFIAGTDRKVLQQARNTIPERIIKGSVTLYPLQWDLRESVRWAPFYNYHINCPLFWTDGRRNLFQIAGLTALELGKKNVEELMVELIEYYEFLEQYGYIKII